MAFSVLNYDPFNPPNQKVVRSYSLQKWEMNTYRQVGNNFHTILSKPTNQPPHSPTEDHLIAQKGPGFSLVCLFPSSMLLPSQVSVLLPVCLFCCCAPALQVFSSVNHTNPSFSRVFLLSWQIQAPGLSKLNPGFLNRKSDFRAINTDSIW